MAVSQHGHFYWNELMTKEPGAAKAFYREVLGWDFQQMSMEDPGKPAEAGAPAYDVKPDVMKADLGGVYYTSYEDALEYFGIGQAPKLKGIIDALNEINVELDLMDAPIPFEAMVDPSLTEGLFEGKTR